MLDGYGIHTLIWDSTDERLGDFLVASPADATGRGLELHVRQGGAAADLTGASVYFLWRHKMAGTRGCEPMAAVDASLGVFKVFYPAAMQEAEGAVDAQCMVSWDDKSISTRRTIRAVSRHSGERHAFYRPEQLRDAAVRADLRAAADCGAG
ncbi:hypothetical protein [Olsenella uli]|uniref:hypothetical protein n=1 Tax=Olsenella uli TaxID=133926 RepID=UPI00044C87A8|nr:hypothetical protein [Olsenella uli]EUB31196.1 hypothetical protein HMPREF1503_1842 [Olsenella uli MSTE5]